MDLPTNLWHRQARHGCVCLVIQHTRTGMHNTARCFANLHVKVVFAVAASDLPASPFALTSQLSFCSHLPFLLRFAHLHLHQHQVIVDWQRPPVMQPFTSVLAHTTRLWIRTPSVVHLCGCFPFHVGKLCCLTFSNLV